MFASSRSLKYYFNITKRWFSSSNAVYGQALFFNKNGAPEEILELKDYSADKKDGQVRVKMLNALINFHDLGEIKKGFSNDLPAIGGSEGVGIVVEPGNSKFSIGDWVIPFRPGTPTWRSELYTDASNLVKVRNDIPQEYAACLSASSLTAVRLLEDFVDLQPGDVVYQSAGNGLIGQTVMQLAAQRGITVISFIRQRILYDYALTVERIKKNGAEVVIPIEFLQKREILDFLSEYPKPKLALDCVGGQAATNLIRLLAPGGTYVSYGGLSKKPTYIPTSAFIFNDVNVRSFFYKNWLAKTPVDQVQQEVDKLADLVDKQKLNFWIESYELWDYKSAVIATNEQRDRKIVLDLQDEVA